jgi:hypothetical protein
MIKASKIVSPDLQQHILVKTLATNNAPSISIYKLGIPEIYLARKATLEYNIAWSFHQSKGDPILSIKFTTQQQKKYNLVKNNP